MDHNWMIVVMVIVSVVINDDDGGEEGIVIVRVVKVGIPSRVHIRVPRVRVSGGRSTSGCGRRR